MAAIATKAAGVFTELSKSMDTTMAGKALGAAPLVSLLALTGISYFTADPSQSSSPIEASRAPFYGEINFPLKASLITGAIASPLAIAGIARLGAILSTNVESIGSALANPMAAKVLEVLPGAARITALVLGVIGVISAFRNEGSTPMVASFTNPKETLVRNEATGNLPLVTILTAVAALVSPVTRSVANYAIPSIVSRVS